MPENALLLLLYSVIDLLRGSLVVALPVFFMALAGSYVRRKISAETKWSWTMSALAATFFVSFILLMLAYFVFNAANPEDTLKSTDASYSTEMLASRLVTPESPG